MNVDKNEAAVTADSKKEVPEIATEETAKEKEAQQNTVAEHAEIMNEKTTPTQEEAALQSDNVSANTSEPTAQFEVKVVDSSSPIEAGNAVIETDDDSSGVTVAQVEASASVSTAPNAIETNPEVKTDPNAMETNSNVLETTLNSIETPPNAIQTTPNAMETSSDPIGTASNAVETNPEVEINPTAAAVDAMEVTEETIIIQSNVLLTPAPEAPFAESDSQEAALKPVECMESLTTTVPTGLSLLAQYDSDAADSNDSAKESDTESVIEVLHPVGVKKDYRTQVVEIKSDSDDDSDSSDSDVEYLSKIRKQIDKTIALSDDDDDEDDEEGSVAGRKGKKRQPPKVKGEMLIDDLPPIQDLHITVPEAECVELGRVHSIIDQLLLVSALSNSLLLDLDTVLFLERGQKVLGAVFDVLGQVADPLYCVRFNSNEQIKERGISIGDTVYVAPKTEYTQFVILSSLMKMRGSDASWENDVEPPPRYVQYSDDEQERDARKELRNKNRPDDHENPIKRSRSAYGGDSGDEEAASTSQWSPAASQRGRGGVRSGNYRPRHPAYNAHNAPPPQHHYQQQQQQHQRSNYNSNFNPGSWHSNYYRQPAPMQHRTGPPPPNYRMPPHHHQQQQQQQQHYHPNSMYSTPPPSFNNGYGAPPPLQTPPPMYVMNPYATIRPPVLPPSGPPPQRQMQSMYAGPPPPPPGSQ